MSFINKIKERAKKDIKTIILPEYMDVRVLKAASICVKEHIANIIIIGNEDEINKVSLKEKINLKNVKIIDPVLSDDTESIIDELYELRKEKGLTRDQAKDLILNDYMYYACMLVYRGIGDGIVSGACHSTSNTLRPALQIIKTSPESKLVSSFFLMVVPECKYGYNGTFVFSDAGLEPNPDSEKLSYIAGDSAKSFKLLTGKDPVVAMLSYSTLGSAAKNDNVDKVVEATKLAKERFPNYLIDGELQLDAAIIPEVAKEKAKDSKVAGKANVLIFPNLDAGNIGYKLVERLAHAEAYGPITQGIKKPINDLSRGCKVDDIVGVIAITAIQAQEKMVK